MATRLRNYNGTFGPKCPDGWRRVEVGEMVEPGDMWYDYDVGEWSECVMGKYQVYPASSICIRRVDPVPAPVAEAPASVGVPPEWDVSDSGPAAPVPVASGPQDACATCRNCADLRKQLDDANRLVETEQACRRIAETACVSAEKATVYHQSEADKARAELDKERAAHEATSAQSMDAHVLLGMKENECERLRADLRATTCDLDRAKHFLSNAEKACAEWQDRAGRMEAQRDEAQADAAALLRVVRLMATGQEAKP